MAYKPKYLFKRSIRKLLSALGYVVIKVDQGRAGTMEAAIATLSRKKHTFNTVIDIGASDGRWSLNMLKHFPQQQYLLIEAQPCHETALRSLTLKYENIDFTLAAAGDSSGYIYFDATDTMGGKASYKPFPENNIRVPVTTVDYAVHSRKLAGPYLLKLDTHGFEIPILDGAKTIIKNTNVLIMECYNFKIADECLLFYEMCEYLKQFNLRCIDMVDPLYRPYDGSFWQMDMIFIKEDSPEFAYSGYR